MQKNPRVSALITTYSPQMAALVCNLEAVFSSGRANGAWVSLFNLRFCFLLISALLFHAYSPSLQQRLLPL